MGHDKKGWERTEEEKEEKKKKLLVRSDEGREIKRMIVTPFASLSFWPRRLYHLSLSCPLFMSQWEKSHKREGKRSAAMRSRCSSASIHLTMT